MSISHLEIAEAEAIAVALREAGGHLEHTARELGISRTTLWRKMKKHQIKAERFRPNATRMIQS